MTEPPEPERAVLEAATDRNRLAETTLALLGYDTQNPPGETEATVDWLASQFESWGVETRSHAVDPGKPNLVARIPGESDATLCLNGHLDTVPYEREEWDRDPLGERVGDRIYGRGATDMKGALAAMVAVARAYATTGVDPPLDLTFAFVSDEETGGEAGLPALLAEGRFDPDACVIGETTSRNGRWSVTVADRGSIWLTLAARGKAAHGSRPMLGVNAVDRVYGAVERLRAEVGTRELALDPEMAAVVDESVGFYEPEAGAEAARDLFEHPTMNLGVLEGGDAVNTVPASATAELDVRVTAGVETRDQLRAVRECLSDVAGVTVADVSWSQGSYEPVDSPLVGAATAAAERVVDGRVYRRSATGGGDAKTLRHAGIPTVELGFGTATAHGTDEYTTLEALVRNARAYAALPAEYARRTE